MSDAAVGYLVVGGLLLLLVLGLVYDRLSSRHRPGQVDARGVRELRRRTEARYDNRPDAGSGP